ncbi:hypothetical protein, partial [Lactobacillus delbrueckii]|uniref:hypothetical protein n=2 Tax=Lactobacillus delbrueckii TaxID=1584 RepID=UPI0021A2E862
PGATSAGKTGIENPAQPRLLLLIAGGIGVVPLLSVIDGSPDLPTKVFYNAHTKESLIYEEKFYYWNSRDNFQSHCQVGRFKDEEIFPCLKTFPVSRF